MCGVRDAVSVDDGVVALLVVVHGGEPQSQPSARDRERSPVARGRVDERLAETLSKTLVPLLLRLEEALWCGVGVDDSRKVVVLADVIRKTVR